MRSISLVLMSANLGYSIGKMLLRYVLVVLVLLPVIARAEVVAYRGDEVKKRCNRNKCEYVKIGVLRGSAVVVGEWQGKTILLTALHNFSADNPVRKYFGFNGRWIRGKCVGYDPAADLCVVECTVGQPRCTPIAHRDGNAGDPISIGGFSAGTQWGMRRGKLGLSYVGWNAMMGVSVPQGVSGGAMFNHAGELIGIVSSAGEDTQACKVEQMRGLLVKTYGTADLCPRSPQKPDTTPAATGPDPKKKPKPDPPSRVGPRGPKGERGPAGPQGAAGPAGKDLNSDLWDRSFAVVVLAPNGKEIDRDTMTLRDLVTGKRNITIQFIAKAGGK